MSALGSINCPEHLLHTRLHSGGSGHSPDPAPTQTGSWQGGNSFSAPEKRPQGQNSLRASPHHDHPGLIPLPHNPGLHRHLVVTLGRAPNRVPLPPSTKGNCSHSTHSALGVAADILGPSGGSGDTCGFSGGIIQQHHWPGGPGRAGYDRPTPPPMPACQTRGTSVERQHGCGM